MKKLLLSLILISLIFSLPAQDGKDINIGKSYVLKSEVLGEERPFSVYLPNGYSPTGNPTPVMYLLDGDYHFHHTTGVVHFLSTQGRMPEMIVVAIPNTTDRTRDLTPEIVKDDQAKKNFPTGGKANTMLSFIKDELMPHIDKQYNTSPYTMLIGHSFGGIFAVNAFLEEPDLFDSYISISPSMWWDDQSLVEKAEKFLDKKPNLNTYFYMTMGNEGGTMLGGAMKLAAFAAEDHDIRGLSDSASEIVDEKIDQAKDQQGPSDEIVDGVSDNADEMVGGPSNGANEMVDKPSDGTDEMVDKPSNGANEMVDRPSDGTDEMIHGSNNDADQKVDGEKTQSGESSPVADKITTEIPCKKQDQKEVRRINHHVNHITDTFIAI